LPGETLGSYVKPKIEILKNERNDKKGKAVEKRTNELLTEIPKGLKI
jgi:fatty acid/phospholipid biosynthesis enzyme